jgi:hypothetical protein
MNPKYHRSMARRHSALVVGLVAAVAVSCSGSKGASETTVPDAVTTLPPSTTTTVVAPDTSTTLAPVNQLTPPSYQIVQRIPMESGGDEVVVLLDPTSYDTLTDLDVYDIVAEVVELFPPVAVMHVVDDAVAANVVADPDASEAAKAVLTTHYLARLDEGFRITYLGPFASSGSAVLGS